LRECIEKALIANRALQIERINPEIARTAVSGTYGYYDPVFTAQVQKEHNEDTGGFDPADFSRDAIYNANSEVASAGLLGFLPSGLSYSLGGGYAHSDGLRNTLNFDSYKLGSDISVRQPLLKNFWTDQGRTDIRVSRKNLKITELGVAFLVMDLINQVQQAYYELGFAREELEVRQRLLSARRATLAGTQRQVEVGTLTVLDERLALSQAARVEAELVSASNLVAQAENALKTLLGYDVTTWSDAALVPAERLIVLPEVLDSSQSWRNAFVRRPDLAQMREDIERANLEVRFRHNQLFPSLDVVAGYGRRGSSALQAIPPASASASLSSAFEQIQDGDAPNGLVGIVLSTPLSRSRERATYRAGKQLKEQALLRLKQKEELVMREISDALFNAQAALEGSQASRRALDYARSALEAEEQKLVGGKSTLFFVLQLQTDLATTESAEVRARANYNKAISQLHFAEGSLLERREVRIEVR
jgi:outer membrane protein TolC